MTPSDDTEGATATLPSSLAGLSQPITQVLTRWIERSDRAIVVGNRDGVIAWTNEAWTRITGRATVDTVSKPVADFLIEAGIELDLVDFVQSHFLRGARCEVELPFTPPTTASQALTPFETENDPAPTPLWIHLVVESIRDEHGEVSDFVAVAEDVTTRKLEEQRLSRDWPRSGVEEPPGLGSNVHSESESESDLESDSSSSSASAGSSDASPRSQHRGRPLPWAGEPIHLSHLTRDALRELAPELGPHRILDAQLAADLPRPFVDELAVRGVVNSLLTCAARTPDSQWMTISVTTGLVGEGPTLRSTVHPAPAFLTDLHDFPYVYLEVCDTARELDSADRQALGIDPARRARSAHRATTRVSARAVALAAARRAAQSCGGELLLDSSVGSGTRRLLLLPVHGSTARSR